MTWSVQLTPWALPPLLGLLIVLRDLGYLWPVRREPGTTALLWLAAVSGVWAVLRLGYVASVPLGLKSLLIQLEYIPAALAPVVWLWFALAYARRSRDLRRWPALSLYAVTSITIVLALYPRAAGILLDDPALFVGEGGVAVAYGWWHWIHVTVRIGVITAATYFLGHHLAVAGKSPFRAALVGVAALVALGPSFVHLASPAAAAGTALNPTGFAFGASILGWGVLRSRLMGLGPVARNLVMEELMDPVVVFDGRGRIVDVNRAAEEFLGLEPYGDVPLPLGTHWAAAPGRSDEMIRISLPVSGEDGGGGDRVFEVNITPLQTRGGDGRVVFVMRDVTDRDRMQQRIKEANLQLARLANTDDLTDLANRRYFMDVLEDEIGRAHRYERPLSIALLDLDHFKKVNDSYGHAAGDEVLKTVAAALESVCREADLAGRVGGEEFMLFLPETTAEGARATAERARRKIEQSRHQSPDGDEFRVTASIGVATLMPAVDDADALLKRADDALYRAKRAGRNQVKTA